VLWEPLNSVYAYVNVCVHVLLHVHVHIILLYMSSDSDSTIPLQSWNEHVSVQKALLPGLWSVMDLGGHGSAKVIYPCFLPLLSQLVDKVTYVGKCDDPLPFVYKQLSRYVP
jgi:hypothetical protein